MEVLNGIKNNFNRILKKIRGKESVFKIILGFVILNLIVLTFWDKWDRTYGKTFYLIEKTQSGSFKLNFTDDTFWIGVICLFIYWFLWGNEKKN